MQKFIYKVRNQEGRVFSGVLEAEDARTLRRNLREKGFYVTSVAPYFEIKKFFGLGSPRVSLDTLTVFTHQLCSTLEAGMPILQALDALWNSTDNPRMQIIISQLRNKLATGLSLAQAMEDFPETFPIIFRSSMSVAESGAGFVPILKRLGEYFEAQREFNAQIKRATVYPVFVVFFSIAVIVFMLTFVVPTFQRVFVKLHVALPAVTQFVIYLSGVARNPISWVLLAGLCIGAFVFYQTFKKTAQGRLILDRAKLRLPLFGKIIYLSCIERIMRSLSLLLSSGVPVIISFNTTREVVLNAELEQLLERATKSISEGVSVTEALRGTKRFPPFVIELVALGEHTGTLCETMGKAAQYMKEELNTRIHRFLILLEPLLIIFVGGMVLFLLLSVYMPIMTLWQTLPNMRT